MVSILIFQRFEQYTTFEDRHANISTVENEGGKTSGKYFYSLRIIKRMETQTEWTCLIK